MTSAIDPAWYKRFKCLSFHLFANNTTGTNFRKSFIILYTVNALQLNFLEIICYHILLSHKSLSSN